MNQTAFSFEPMARRSDPVTSHLAAADAKELAAAHQSSILHTLEAHGALGKDGIAQLSRLDGHAVARRLPELQRMGLVVTTGNMVFSDAGRLEREWRLA